MGIKKFVAHRGTQSVIWSDNGTNFVGEEKELLKCIQSLKTQAPAELAKKVLKRIKSPGSPLSQWIMGTSGSML